MKLWKALGIFVVLSLSACKQATSEAGGQWKACSCEYLTDRDEPGRIDVEVCAAREAPSSMARSCAEGLGVGAVSECDCNGGARDACPNVGACRELQGR